MCNQAAQLFIDILVWVDTSVFSRATILKIGHNNQRLIPVRGSKCRGCRCRGGSRQHINANLCEAWPAEGNNQPDSQHQRRTNTQAKSQHLVAHNNVATQTQLRDVATCHIANRHIAHVAPLPEREQRMVDLHLLPRQVVQ